MTWGKQGRSTNNQWQEHVSTAWCKEILHYEHTHKSFNWAGSRTASPSYGNNNFSWHSSRRFATPLQHVGAGRVLDCIMLTSFNSLTKAVVRSAVSKINMRSNYYIMYRSLFSGIRLAHQLPTVCTHAPALELNLGPKSCPNACALHEFATLRSCATVANSSTQLGRYSSTTNIPKGLHDQRLYQVAGLKIALNARGLANGAQA